MEAIETYQQGDLVLLEWVDSAKDERVWVYGEYTPQIMKIKSCGLVFQNNPEVLSLTTCFDKKNEGGVAPMNIPWACITKIQEVS